MTPIAYFANVGQEWGKMADKIKAGFPGVRFREHPTRKHGIRKDRYFFIRYRVGGKVREEAVGWSSEGMTAQKAFTLLSTLKENIRTGSGAQTLSEMRHERQNLPQQVEVTIAYLWEKFKKDKTYLKSIEVEAGYYRKHIHSMLGQTRPEELSAANILMLRDTMLKEGFAPQTVKNVLSLLRRIIRWGEKLELCELPKAIRTMDMPKVDNITTENLTEEQIKRLLEVLAQDHDQQAANAMRLALCTGIRKTALLSLRWDDLDFERNFITLRGENAKKGKTDVIPMPQAARMIFLSISRFNEYVFPSSTNPKGHRLDCYRSFRRIRKNARLPEKFRPMHGLRHTFASLLASSGKVDLLTLQKLLTHGSPQMTQRYAHLHDEALKKASAVIDEFMERN